MNPDTSSFLTFMTRIDALVLGDGRRHLEFEQHFLELHVRDRDVVAALLRRDAST
jgi:hypothetical protein